MVLWERDLGGKDFLAANERLSLLLNRVGYFKFGMIHSQE